MAVYEDGSRDCPACLTADVTAPNRVRGDRLTLCTRCDTRAHSEAMAGFAEMQPYMRKRLGFTDWLIEHHRRETA